MRIVGLRVLMVGATFLLSACAFALDTERIVQQNQWVSVVVVGQDAQGAEVVQASGCVVDKAGWVLATAHQVQAAGVKKFVGRLYNKTEHLLKVVEVAAELDLALLKSDDAFPLAASIGDASRLKSGSELIAITTPENLEFTAAKGMVTNAHRTYQDRPFLQTDLPFSQGSSGGPVFDESGVLIGVVFGRIDLEGLPATLICPINRAFPMMAKHGVGGGGTSVTAPGEEIKAIAMKGGPGARLDATREYNLGVAASTIQEKKRLYLAAVGSDSEFFEAWFNLGVTYASDGQNDKAIEAYKRAASLRPNAVAVHRNLGRLLLKSRRMDDVLVCFERAVELAPNDAGAHNDLGEALRQSGKYDQAEASFQKALGLDHGYAPAQYNLALTYVALNRPADAVQNLEGYLKARPGASDADRVRAWITQLKTNGKLDKP